MAVCRVVDVNAGHAPQQDEQGQWQAQVVWVGSQVEGVACVDGGHPHKTSPTLHHRAKEAGITVLAYVAHCLLGVEIRSYWSRSIHTNSQKVFSTYYTVI